MIKARLALHLSFTDLLSFTNQFWRQRYPLMMLVKHTNQAGVNLPIPYSLLLQSVVYRKDVWFCWIYFITEWLFLKLWWINRRIRIPQSGYFIKWRDDVKHQKQHITFAKRNSATCAKSMQAHYQNTLNMYLLTHHVFDLANKNTQVYN